jgi:hypothetical protein
MLTTVARALLLFAILTAPCTLAQAANQGSSCMECHRPNHVVIDPDRYERSVHGALDCTTCHSEGVDRFPHTPHPADAPDCKDCHSGTSGSIDFEKIEMEFQASIHIRANPAFRCTNCHSPHYFIPSSRMTDVSEAIAAANQSCLHCHAFGTEPAAQQTAFEALAAKHSLFPHADLHLQRVTCVACHATNGQENLHLIVPKSQAARDCAVCHAKNSILATKLYTHLAVKERAEHGWANAIFFNNAYLTGANRNHWLDLGSVLLALLTVIGAAAHGIGRLIFDYFRRRK